MCHTYQVTVGLVPVILADNMAGPCSGANASLGGVTTFGGTTAVNIYTQHSGTFKHLKEGNMFQICSCHLIRICF